MRQEKTGSSVRKAKMLDPKNSTQISNKGETNRVTPIGGAFAFFEEKEPELGADFSAIGNLDFQLPTKIASTLFKAGEWTTIAVGEAVTGLAKDIFVSEKPKPQPKPEEKKKMEDGLALRQAMAVIENSLRKNTQQDQAKLKLEEVRIIGRPISIEEASKKLGKSTSFKGLSGKLSYHDLVELRRIETDEENMAKKAKMQQTRISTSKGTNLSNRTDAQEGQSTTANAITSAG